MLSRSPVTLNQSNESYYNQKLIREGNRINDEDEKKSKQQDKKHNAYFYQKWG